MMDTSPLTGEASFETFTDDELLSAVRSGDTGAYSVLYHRHFADALHHARRLGAAHDPDDVAQEAFLKILRSTLRGGGPREGFAGYLMRVVRNEAIDRSRRAREFAVDDVETIAPDGFVVSDGVDELFDRQLMRRAFVGLPEKWQRILWLTEVEGETPRSLAPQLKQSPNAVAQLSRRAREGLRAAWLQVHVDVTSGEDGCREVAQDLGAYERGRLKGSRAARVEAHLEGCVRCTAALAELRQISARMRGVLLPVVLGTSALLENLSPVLSVVGQGVLVEAGAVAAGSTGAGGPGTLIPVDGGAASGLSTALGGGSAGAVSAVRTALMAHGATIAASGAVGAVVVGGLVVLTNPQIDPPSPAGVFADGGDDEGEEAPVRSDVADGSRSAVSPLQVPVVEEESEQSTSESTIPGARGQESASAVPEDGEEPGSAPEEGGARDGQHGTGEDAEAAQAPETAVPESGSPGSVPPGDAPSVGYPPADESMSVMIEPDDPSDRGPSMPVPPVLIPLPGAPVPEGPAAPTEPEAPAAPTAPEDPAEPTESEEPAKPEGPTAPTEPSVPADPGEPDVPTVPEEPAEPTGPDEPAEPAEPEEPAEPTEPDEPTEPEEPAEPEEPEEPTEPEEPEEPTEPDEPAEPDEPVDPALAAPEVEFPTGGTFALPVTLTGTGEPGATVRALDDTEQEVGTTEVAQDGSWSLSPAPGAPDVPTAYRVLQEKDGEVSESVGADEEYVYLAPQIFSPADGSTIPGQTSDGTSSVLLTFITYGLGEEQEYSLWVDGRRWDMAARAPGSLVSHLVALADGEHRVQIAYRDPATGRLGALRTITFTVT